MHLSLQIHIQGCSKGIITYCEQYWRELALVYVMSHRLRELKKQLDIDEMQRADSFFLEGKLRVWCDIRKNILLLQMGHVRMGQSQIMHSNNCPSPWALQEWEIIMSDYQRHSTYRDMVSKAERSSHAICTLQGGWPGCNQLDTGK